MTERELPAEFPIIQFDYFDCDSDSENGEEILEDLDLGSSWVGGGFVDLPPGISCPEDHEFIAQLDMERFSKSDPVGLLPTTGHLYFFFTFRGPGKVLYWDGERKDLKRVKASGRGVFPDRKEIAFIRTSVERLDSRYYREEDGKRAWDCFAGGKLSKVYGIHTNCQMREGEILRETAEKVVLLQIGEGYTGEGVLTASIAPEDLKARDFSKCVMSWGQS